MFISGTQFKEARRLAGLSQRQVVTAIGDGLGRRTLTRIEGAAGIPDGVEGWTMAQLVMLYEKHGVQFMPVGVKYSDGVKVTLPNGVIEG